jgi:ribosomal protein L40E
MSEMRNPWVCLDCGARYAEAGNCRDCGKEDVLDARREDVRALMADVELRLGDRREARIRWFAVVVSIAIIVGAWLVPGYWSLRGTLYPGIPFLLDQWIFMALLGFGILKLGERVFAHKRFPYLDEQQQIT